MLKLMNIARVSRAMSPGLATFPFANIRCFANVEIIRARTEKMWRWAQCRHFDGNGLKETT